MKTTLLILAGGLLPLVAGGLMDRLMMRFTLPLRLIAVAALVAWGALAAYWQRRGERRLKILLLQNLPAAVDLLLLGIQLLANGHYWLNPLGSWSQLYYLPVLSLGFTLTPWSRTAGPAYAVGFCLLLAASALACYGKEVKALGKRAAQLPKGYYAAAVPLLIWGAVDLSHYSRIGVGLLDLYAGSGSVAQLVENTLLQGIVKLLLAALILGIGLWRAGRKKRRASTAVSWLLVLSVGGLWLLSMGLVTVVLAQETYDELYQKSDNFPEAVDNSGLLGEFYDPQFNRYLYHYECPDFFEHQMLQAISRTSNASFRNSGNYSRLYPHGGERSKLIRDLSYDVETAVLFYDGEGRLLFDSDDDVLYFDYFTQAEWDAGKDSAAGLHYGWIDISDGKDAEEDEYDPYLRLRNQFAGTRSLRDLTLRVTGWFDGTELKPVTMHYITDSQIHTVVEGHEQFSTGENSHTYILSDVDRTGALEWQLQFDHSADHPDKELVTVYIDGPEMWDAEEKPLLYRGTEYASLAALTEALDFPARTSLYQNNPDLRLAGNFELDELLVFSGWRYADYAGRDHSSTAEPETEFILVTAMRSSPLRCAMSALRNIYLLSALLAAVLILTLRAVLRRQLIAPVESVNAHITAGWTRLSPERESPPDWWDGVELLNHYSDTSDLLRLKNNEITRLTTALDYAREAELSRRQMTSNIAHELKTPLAVIHSYAEGLKENIAEEKRDAYLDVILSETERTDAMVLEMLDLSRLEAGKVKLSRDEFSLCALVRSVFQRLERPAQAKALTLSFDLPEECPVVADEGRIAQVIENLASNAVKYTPEGGSIRIGLRSGRGSVTLTVENDSPPFTPEQLSRIWDAFYRVDGARSGGGTGLGLSIAKSIIELHGGRCAVNNIPGGVAFSFTL